MKIMIFMPAGTEEKAIELTIPQAPLKDDFIEVNGEWYRIRSRAWRRDGTLMLSLAHDANDTDLSIP